MAHTNTDLPAETKAFADFGIDARLCEVLTDGGITEPFPIQELTLPMALSGADVIGQARTGTGKTLAFGLPALQRTDPATRQVQVLVIVPTRELCLQVAGELEQAGARLGLSLVAGYGGRPIEPQAQALADGAHVVVGTPGRLLDLHHRGMLDLSQVATLVLDEADEMLDLGFLPDVEQLIGLCPTQRQTLLFSATMPSPVVALARRYMSKPTFVRAEEDRSALSPDTSHCFLSCHRLDKPAVLARILQSPERGLCVVFTRTKRMADQLAKELADRDVDAAAIHSDLRQDARERALRRFRDGKVTVLVATEVAARGLDIDHVTHVINYDCPDDEKMYLHRIGRTGRAGAAGAAITLAVWNELARLEMIKKALSLADQPTHEVFSTSSLLDELFDLPPATSARRRSAGPEAHASADGGGSTRAGDGAGQEGDSGQSSGRDGDGQGRDRRRRRGGRGGRGSGGRVGGRDHQQRGAGQSDGTPGDDSARPQAGDRVGDADTANEADGPAGVPATESQTPADGAVSNGQAAGEHPTAAAEAPSRSDHGAADGGDAGTHQSSGDAGADGEPRRRQRTRTRTRTQAGAPSATPASGAAPPARTADTQRQRSRTRTRTRTAAQGRETAGGSTQQAPSAGGDDGGSSGKGRQAGGRDGGQGSRSRQGGGKQRNGPRGDAGTKGQSGNSKPGNRRGKRQAGRSGGPRRPAVSAAEARGDGRPRIRRPLQVEHLP